MLGGRGCGANGLGIGGVGSRQAKIVPKSYGGWKDGSGLFGGGRLRAVGGQDGSKVGVSWSIWALSAEGPLRGWPTWSTALFSWG